MKRPGNSRFFRCACALSTALLLAPASTLLAAKDSPARLFEDDSTLVVRMIAPFQELVADEDYEGSYPARLEYTDESGQEVTIEMTVERRGLTRQRVCRIPPIKLRFEKGAAKGTPFRGQENLKMVTHCKSNDRYEQYYMLEMLAYRIYNVLTDYSFRVRPLEVTYFQTGFEDQEEEKSGFSFFKKKTMEGPVFAFLIEEDKEVANRHDLKNLHIPQISPGQLDNYEASLFALFQYLVGNTDWAALSGPDPSECCHNVKLIGPEPTRPEDTLFAIPYDFDSSGLVDSEYAAPPDILPISSVTTRLYRGYCVHNGSLEAARQKILVNKDAIYAVLDSEPRLDSGRKRKAERYLAGFFETLEDDAAFRERIVDKCRG